MLEHILKEFNESKKIKRFLGEPRCTQQDLEKYEKYESSDEDSDSKDYSEERQTDLLIKACIFLLDSPRKKIKEHGLKIAEFLQFLKNERQESVLQEKMACEDDYMIRKSAANSLSLHKGNASHFLRRLRDNNEHIRKAVFLKLKASRQDINEISLEERYYII